MCYVTRWMADINDPIIKHTKMIFLQKKKKYMFFFFFSFFHEKWIKHFTQANSMI